MNRRKYLVDQSLLLAGLSLAPVSVSRMGARVQQDRFISKRPIVSKRTFISEAIENVLTEITPQIRDEELAWMFGNCFPNTLDTTVDYELINGRPDTFIITGDIDAMWLRDSTAQVWPYMPFIKHDHAVKNLIMGLISRQVKCILTDPYANAFYKDLSRESEWKSDIPSPSPGVHERKWEIDSLCYAVRLSHRYYELTGDASAFDAAWDRAMRLVVSTLKTEQRKDGTSPYTFRRKTTAMIDAPVFDGTGRPIRPTGMICSMFRPSDDATMYPYLVPSNIFAVLSLRHLARLYRTALNDRGFADECDAFADEVEQAIDRYAKTDHPQFGSMYAYEVDGFGNRLFMDDANVPSLMSLAYLGAHLPTDPVYANTRRFLLSDANPYFLRGKAAEGQASPHTGKEKIWPMGIILRAMTSTDRDEIRLCLQMLKNTHAGTGYMHEAFHKDNPADYNRAWFAWANTLFGELIIKIYHEHPVLLSKSMD
jgi:meiotically up-regulated gene 157 (Mug157) protein